MTCPDLGLGLFLPGLAEVGICHLVSKRVEMLEIETTDLYHPSLVDLELIFPFYLVVKVERQEKTFHFNIHFAPTYLLH